MGSSRRCRKKPPPATGSDYLWRNSPGFGGISVGLVSEIRGLIGAPRRGRPSTRQPAATTAGRIVEIEAALGRLQRERETASQAIATASERRRALLLGDAPDGEV